MPTLIGHAFQSGTVTFSKQENAWAFRRLDEELKHGQENRIVFSPNAAPVSIEPTENAKPEDLPWLPRLRELINSATAVYLQRHEGLLRFRQAIHRLDANSRIVTLGSPQEVSNYCAEHWQKISHFYATRREGFRFDIIKIVVRDKDLDRETDRIEVNARITNPPHSSHMQLTFDATGATVHNDLILWRKTVGDGETGRFTSDRARVALNVINFKQPVSLCEEYHEDFHSRWYLFDADTLKSWLAKLAKQKKADPGAG